MPLLFNRILKPLPIALLRLVFQMILILQLGAPSQAHSQAASGANVGPVPGKEATAAQVPPDLSNKRVLLLHAYSYEAAYSVIMNPIFVKEFVDVGLGVFNLHFEFMDQARHPEPAYREDFVKYLGRKYAKHSIDLIIALHTPTLNFLIEEGKNLFPRVPVINVIAASEYLSDEDWRNAYEPRVRSLKRPLVIMPFLINIEATVNSIISLQPGIRGLVVISGSSLLDKMAEQSVRRSLGGAWQARLSIEYWSGLALEETLKRVALLTPETVVLIANFSADPDGRIYSPPAVVRRISRAANAPVFGLFETLLEDGGIVGGVMPTFRGEAIRTVELALQVLRGNLPTEPVTLSQAPFVPIFDWEQLNRWNMDENRLPPGSIVLNRPKTIWTEYKGLLIGAIAVFLAQTLLVIGLLIQRNLKKRAELSLRQKTEELDQFFNVSLDLLCIANTDGYFLRLNPAAGKILGYAHEEIMARQFLDFVHPDDLERTREAVSILASQEKIASFENRFRCKDGTYKWLQWSSAPAGKLIYAAARDVTEHKRAEEALRENEKEARRIAKEALAMAEIGRIISSTLSVEEVYEPFAAVVKKIIPFDRIVINLVDTETSTVRNVYMAGGEIRDREVEKVYALEGSGNAEMLRTKSCFLLQTEDFKDYQERFPMLLSTFQAGFRSILNVPLLSQGKIIGGLLFRSYKPFAYTDEDVRLAERIGNQIAGAIANAQLFLREKKTEEALRDSEDRFRQVAESVGDFIWEVEADGLYRYTSPSVERILGYRPDELVGKKHFYDLFAPEVREELKAAALSAFAAKQPFRGFANPNVSKEGRVVHLETSGGAVLDAAGNLLGYRGADTDVTERRWAEEELRRHQEHLEELIRERTAELVMARDQADVANRAKSTFLANMSHELRTPLNSILGIAQLMERDAGFPGQHRDTLKILSRSGTHLLELINDVLEMSKIEAGKMALVMTSFDLHSFLGDLEEMTRLRTDQKGLTLIFERRSDLPQYIETDLRKLRQVLINLLGNAIKYTEKGRVTLRIAFREGMGTTPEANLASSARLEFEVEDTGIGIPPEDRQRIFEPFVQLNPGRTTRDGTGLGLTLSRMFIELLGGEITIHSQIGKGSIFGFDIAVKLAEGAAVHTREADRQAIGLLPGQPPYRLLIVDDSAENRFVLRQLLERVGFQVLEAAGAQEAVDLYKSGQPHLIWMDLRMPGMDGNEAARRIREAESGKRTPIIALTAGILDPEGPPSPSPLFDSWVYKPFRESEIFDKLEKHLGAQFLYQPSVGSALEAEKGPVKAALTPADLAVLPVGWLREFSQMLRKGRSAQLIELIGRIPQDRAGLAGNLVELVRVHQFDRLIPLVREALKENADG